MASSVLIFHAGQLGDTMVALPAFHAVRRHFPHSRRTLLFDQHIGQPYVLATDLLQGTRLFDAFESYPVDHSRMGRALRPARMLALLAKLRRQRHDTLVYLMGSGRTPTQVRRDKQFFAAAGIRNFIGTDGFAAPPPRAIPLSRVPHETDLLLARLAAAGVPVPAPGEARMDLVLGPTEEAIVDAWLTATPADGGRVWIGVGPGSKMPAKRWPLERFSAVIATLIEEHDVWPVIFGGGEDRAAGDAMIAQWGRGANAAGLLAPRAAAAALRRCRIYVGNDTGTMHLAVAAEVPCVAIFSARDWPGRWYPYGRGHQVVRSQLECEGCGLSLCREQNNECLQRISAEQVTALCRQLLHEACVSGQESQAVRASV